MNIDSSRLSISSQNNLMKKLFSKTQEKNAGYTDPMGIFADEAIAAKNRAKYFDENGEPLNSSGEKGRYIGGGKDWKKIISVSDEVKKNLVNLRPYCNNQVLNATFTFFEVVNATTKE